MIGKRMRKIERGINASEGRERSSGYSGKRAADLGKSGGEAFFFIIIIGSIVVRRYAVTL